MNETDHQLPSPSSTDGANPINRGNNMELLIIVGFMVAWFVLQMWILPKMGVST